MLTERILRANPTLIKALTGLPADVFWQLIADLEAKLPEYEHQRHERSDRQRAVGAGRRYDQPLVIRAMLVLTCMQLHVAQEIVALIFGAAQPDVSRDLRRLLPLIAQMVPAPEVSEAVPGAMHDKKLSDGVKTVERLPDGCEVDADKGYQGLDKQVTCVIARNAETGEEQRVPRVQVKTPFKKPKGKELTDEQEEFNRQLSAIRVRVEHCIGWVKNWAIIATRFRCAHSIYTLILRVVCGFVNMQTERWQLAKAQAAA
jgi:hypothetical protein